MKKAVIYARFSSSKQNETSISGQLNTCNQYAERNKIEVVDTYIDRAISGTTDNRPQFQQMISDSKYGTFDMVLVYATDRFSRDRHDSIYYKKELKNNGVTVVSCTESIPQDDNGILIESIYEALSEMYIHNLRKNVKRGRNERAKNSESVGGTTPLGYRIVNRKYVIDEKGAEAVRIIYKMYADGSTKKEIADFLNIQGYKTTKGTKFTSKSFNTILSNRKYLGIYKLNDIENIGGMPRIINVKLFKKVQARIKENKGNKRPNRKKYILTGKVFCSECGAAMTGTSGQGKYQTYYYYRCKNKCNSVRKEKLENVVSEMTLNMLISDEIKKTIIDTTYDYYLAQIKNNNAEALENALKSTNKQINQTVDAVANGFQSEAIKEKLERLEREKDEILTEMAKQAKIEAESLKKEDIEYALDKLIENGLDSEEDNRILFDSFIENIKINKAKKISIEYSILKDECLSAGSNGGPPLASLEYDDYSINFYGNLIVLKNKLNIV